MPVWAQILVTVIASLLSSSGLFTIILHFIDKKDAKKEMILGLGHDRIIAQSKIFIEQGYISPEDYENLYDYLYLPYKKLGGNGTAEKMVNQVMDLPCVPPEKKGE